VTSRSIEIHDSTLERIWVSGSEAQLHFSLVYIHQSEGLLGEDAGQVWTQPAVLRIFSANVSGSFSELPVRLAGGSVRLGEVILDNTIPVPLRHEGTFELRLEFFRERLEVVKVGGNGAELELLGEAKYLEEFRP